MRFEYLLSKIKNAPFQTEPFTHIEIRDFFSSEHFSDLIRMPEIDMEPQINDEALINRLFGKGYKIIEFPGCITDKNAYLQWHKQRKESHAVHTACEGFGLTMRLTAPQTPFIEQVFEFISSDQFQAALADKFGIDRSLVFYDWGIQKYLDGYEISPHPDIRRKALTYMININPGKGSEDREHHTHYLKFKEAYKYVQSYWEGRPGEDRCWVPWDWCETVKQQRENNSIVIFSPGNSSMHGVKASYDHLKSQRTQLYGNLWYSEVGTRPGPEWEDFIITSRHLQQPKLSITDKVKAVIPTSVKTLLKSHLKRDGSNKVIADRLNGK